MVVREPRVQPPSLEAYADTPLLNTKGVVHQTGVPAPTLRAWERRYGILAPRRGENDYRLYSERDMMTIIWLRERVETGLTISQAIALLRSLDPMRHRDSGLALGGLHDQAAPRDADDADFYHAAIPNERDQGEQTPTPPPTRFALEELSRALLHQFITLDEYAANRTIAQALAIYPIEEVCLSLFTPTLVEVGRLWATGEAPITVEHFGSALVRAQLDGLFRSASIGERGPLALVGCAAGEQHELGSLMLALFLRRAGLRVVYLGQNVEVENLLTTIASFRPACVALSATLPAQGQALIAVCQRLRASPEPRPALFFGGQAFCFAPELATQAMGCYLGMNAYDAAQSIRSHLALAA